MIEDIKLVNKKHVKIFDSSPPKNFYSKYKKKKNVKNSIVHRLKIFLILIKNKPINHENEGNHLNYFIIWLLY